MNDFLPDDPSRAGWRSGGLGGRGAAAQLGHRRDLAGALAAGGGRAGGGGDYDGRRLVDRRQAHPLAGALDRSSGARGDWPSKVWPASTPRPAPAALSRQLSG